MTDSETVQGVQVPARLPDTAGRSGAGVAGRRRDQQRSGVPSCGLGRQVSDAPLADNSAARIVKRYARRVGPDPASYVGHSLRAGFLTSAPESSPAVFKMKLVNRHKSKMDVLSGYVQAADLFKAPAASVVPVTDT